MDVAQDVDGVSIDMSINGQSGPAGINRHLTVDVLSTNDPGYKWFQPRFLNAESNALTIKPYTSHLSVQLYGFPIRFQCYESD